MDLGGGSGVVAMTLVRRSSVVSAMFSNRVVGSSWSTSSSRRKATRIGPDWAGTLSEL
jgi:hypothetical protein